MQEIQDLAWQVKHRLHSLFPILYFPAFTNLFESLNHPCGHPAVASDLTKTLKWVKEVLDRSKEEVTQAPKPGETK